MQNMFGFRAALDALSGCGEIKSNEMNVELEMIFQFE
jgi:hypothetical protein